LKKNNSILFYNKYAQFYKKYDILVKRGVAMSDSAYADFTEQVLSLSYE